MVNLLGSAIEGLEFGLDVLYGHLNLVHCGEAGFMVTDEGVWDVVNS
jgi:hypothetical protein